METSICTLIILISGQRITKDTPVYISNVGGGIKRRLQNSTVGGNWQVDQKEKNSLTTYVVLSTYLSNNIRNTDTIG